MAPDAMGVGRLSRSPMALCHARSRSQPRRCLLWRPRVSIASSDVHRPVLGPYFGRRSRRRVFPQKFGRIVDRRRPDWLWRRLGRDVNFSLSRSLAVIT